MRIILSYAAASPPLQEEGPFLPAFTTTAIDTDNYCLNHNTSIVSSMQENQMYTESLM